jgi:hypothetical protein
MSEVKERFPRSVADFACLEPRHFDAIDAEERVRRLAMRITLMKLQPLVSGDWLTT